MNTAAERINGVDKDDIIGRNMNELVTSELVERSAALEVIETKETVSFLCATRGGENC